MKKNLYLKTNKDIRMMTDPYRFSIVQVFKSCNDIGYTVKEIADRLGEPHGKVYYHVKKLADYGALEVVDTKVINGIVSKYYNLTFDNMTIVDDEGTNYKSDLKMNETIKMIQKIYNDSRDDYVETIMLYENLKKEDNLMTNEVDNGFISLGNIFLDSTNYREFREELFDVINKYAEQDPNSEQIKKTIMVSVYPDIEELKKKVNE